MHPETFATDAQDARPLGIFDESAKKKRFQRRPRQTATLGLGAPLISVWRPWRPPVSPRGGLGDFIGSGFTVFSPLDAAA
ncbi:MAG: hypothetical protein A2Z31_02705 [candidate division NC10 bacterium RBG_16_65_8]|nr:MAG: hypothetical protein A2Z31_02705 [candidate division NC10 bacterium RBG_16_65_8]